MWHLFPSYTDLSFLNTGDKVKIQFTPHSQKHFADPNYDYFFPVYEGTVVSVEDSRDIDRLLIETINHKMIYCVNRAGTSGFMTAYYTRDSNAFDPVIEDS